MTVLASARPAPVATPNRANCWTVRADAGMRSPFAADHDNRADEYAAECARLTVRHPNVSDRRLNELANAHCAIMAPAGGWRS